MKIMLLPKIWIICRVCLKQQEEMFNIFDDKVIKSVWTILRDCGGVPVRKNDDLPDKICETCLKKLWKASSFRSDCQRGHRELVQMLMERKINMYELDLEDEKKFCCSEIISISDTTNEYPASSPTLIPQSQTSNTPTIKDDTIATISNDQNSIENETKKHNNIKHYCVVTKNKNNEEKFLEEPTKLTRKKEPIVLLLKLKNIPPLKNQTKTITKDAPIETERKQRTKKLKATKLASSSSSLSSSSSSSSTSSVSNKAEIKLNEKGILKTTTVKAKFPTDKETKLKKSKSKNIKNLIKEKTKFSCKICKKSYKTYILLRHHNYTHNRPHQCKICKKRFSQIQSFLSHTNSHNGLKPYSCRFCNKTFADISNRNSHERTKHTNEQFKCEKCNKTFRFLPLLRKHTQAHRPKKCLICNKDFATLQMVRVHHQRKHLKLLNDNKY